MKYLDLHNNAIITDIRYKTPYILKNDNGIYPFDDTVNALLNSGAQVVKFKIT